MKPQLIITTLGIKNIETTFSDLNIYTMVRTKSSVNIGLEIELTGKGDFSDYVLPDKTFNREKLVNDIFRGNIKIVGINNMK